MSAYLKELIKRSDPSLNAIAIEESFVDCVGFQVCPLARHPVSLGVITKYKRDFAPRDVDRAKSTKVVRLGKKEGDSVTVDLRQKGVEVPIDDSDWMDSTNPSRARKREKKDAVKQAQDYLSAQIEYKQAKIITDVSNYASGNVRELKKTEQFDNDASDPVALLAKDIEKVARAAKVPTTKLTVMIASSVYAFVTQNKAVLDRQKMTAYKTITLADLAAILMVKKVVVGESLYEQDGEKYPIWGDYVGIYYAPEDLKSVKTTPVFAATLRQEGYPIVIPYREQSSVSEIIQYLDQLEPVSVEKKSGVLYKNVLSVDNATVK